MNHIEFVILILCFFLDRKCSPFKIYDLCPRRVSNINTAIHSRYRYWPRVCNAYAYHELLLLQVLGVFTFNARREQDKSVCSILRNTKRLDLLGDHEPGTRS